MSMTLPQPRHTTECCGVRAIRWQDDGGAYVTLCDECSEPTCSACAASFDQDGGYGENGQDFGTHATCRNCERN